MKDRIKDFIKVALMIGTCLAGIFFIYQLEGKATTPNHNVTPPDTVASVPVFMNKSAKEGLKDALKYYDIQHPNIVYAQALLETGHFKSVGCLRHNNLFGLYNNKAKRYCRFNHWTESVIAYKEWIQKRYKPPEDYYSFLRKMGYAKDPKYIHKLKQIVNSNDKRRSLGGGKDYPQQECLADLTNWVWKEQKCYREDKTFCKEEA